MKRSIGTGLVTLVASWLVCGSAFAATPTRTSSPITSVAAADDAAPSTAPAAPTAGQPSAPGPDSAAPSAGPAPAPDAPAASKASDDSYTSIKRFAGSSIFLQNSMTTSTVFRQQLQYSNPTVETTAFLLPRYAINKAFQVRARLLVSYEYTNSDSTTYRNEPTLSDTGLSLFYRALPKLPLGIIPNVAVNVGLPTSKDSRARTVVATPGATLQLARPFENFLKGEGMVLANLTFAHPFYSSKNPEVVDPRPAGAFTCVGGNNCQDLLSGRMNVANSLSYSALVTMEWGHWSPAIFYLGNSQWVYAPTEAKNPVDQTPITSPAGFEPTGTRQTHYFSVWLDYNFANWITGEVGYWNSTRSVAADGKYTNPIYNQYGDTRVYLGASIQVDNLVKLLQGQGEGDGGVVRAKNTKQPMWTF